MDHIYGTFHPLILLYSNNIQQFVIQIIFTLNLPCSHLMIGLLAFIIKLFRFSVKISAYIQNTLFVVLWYPVKWFHVCRVTFIFLGSVNFWAIKDTHLQRWHFFYFIVTVSLTVSSPVGQQHHLSWILLTIRWFYLFSSYNLLSFFP